MPDGPGGPYPRSKWIVPQVSQDGFLISSGLDIPGLYVYQTTFDLTGFNSTMASLKGAWAADNVGDKIVLNGYDTGPSNVTLFSSTVVRQGFKSLAPFSILNSSWFQSGINTLDFWVTNDEPQTGLLVANLMLMACPLPCDPYPMFVTCPPLTIRGIRLPRNKR